MTSVSTTSRREPGIWLVGGSRGFCEDETKAGGAGAAALVDDTADASREKTILFGLRGGGCWPAMVEVESRADPLLKGSCCLLELLDVGDMLF